jgi:hypothetical protein
MATENETKPANQHTAASTNERSFLVLMNMPQVSNTSHGEITQASAF